MAAQGKPAAAAAAAAALRHLPPGFKFQPTDVEIVDHYLRRRLNGFPHQRYSFIHDCDVYAHHPWDLFANNIDADSNMYFFTPRQRTSNNSKRVSRIAGCGMWDCHAHDIVIRHPISHDVIGHKVQLNFKILGDGKRKMKTSWIMHEYRLHDHPGISDKLVLCKIYKKKANSSEEEAEKNMRMRLAAEREPIHHHDQQHRQPMSESGTMMTMDEIEEIWQPSSPSHDEVAAPDASEEQALLDELLALLDNADNIAESQPLNHHHQQQQQQEEERPTKRQRISESPAAANPPPSSSLVAVSSSAPDDQEKCEFVT